MRLAVFRALCAREDSRVLYRLPEVLAAIAAGETIAIVDGESDADAL